MPFDDPSELPPERQYVHGTMQLHLAVMTTLYLVGDNDLFYIESGLRERLLDLYPPPVSRNLRRYNRKVHEAAKNLAADIDITGRDLEKLTDLKKRLMRGS